MSATKEWSRTDKSAWGPGAWQGEPDKVQWVDEATSLDCLAVRGPHGGWCGYVGVPESHPWFGKDYGQCPRGCEESWCGHSPESSTEVHGGLTFASACADASPEMFARFQARLREDEVQAVKYPRGDSAERLKTLGHLRDEYAAWLAHHEATAICHVAEPGRPEHVWWFGFDCAHSGDLSPKYANDERMSLLHRRGDVYRTLDYVREQCTALAAQLARVSATDSPA